MILSCLRAFNNKQTESQMDEWTNGRAEWECRIVFVTENITVMTLAFNLHLKTTCRMELIIMVHVCFSRYTTPTTSLVISERTLNNNQSVNEIDINLCFIFI